MKPAPGSRPFCVSGPSPMIPAWRVRGRRARGARPRAGGTERRCRLGRPPPRSRAARAATGAGGCRGGRLWLPGGGVRSTGPADLTRGRSSSSSRAAALRAPPVPSQPVSGQTFLRLQVSLRRRDHGARPGRPLAGREGAGRGLCGSHRAAWGRCPWLPLVARAGRSRGQASAPRAGGAERPPGAGSLGSRARSRAPS